MTSPYDGRLALEVSAKALVTTVDIPAYLHETYTWAYLNPRNVRLLVPVLALAAMAFLPRLLGG